MLQDVGFVVRRLLNALGVAIVATLTLAAPQDLSPEMQLLVRIKSHMREELSRLSNYTCLETIARFHQEPTRQTKLSGHLKPLDTVRLEIVYSNRQEWYGAPGGRNFSTDDPGEFVGSGMIGSGAFGIKLHNIFETAQIIYRGQEDLAGRAAVKYDFRVPGKPTKISIPGGVGTVGEEGSFWVDRQSLDLLRVDSRAIDIPPYLPLEETSTSETYARTQIGEHTTLLAQHADLQMLETTGRESYDRIEFTHCRAFAAQSALRFDSESRDPAESLPPDHPKAVPDMSATVQAVPAFLLITVQLTKAITNEDAVGTLIEAKVSGDVVRKGKIVIPKSSLVRGRIRRLERYQDSGSADFIVGLEFTEVEVNSEPLRFYADFVRMDKSPGFRSSLSEQVLVSTGIGSGVRSQTITLPELPGVASFFVHGRTFTVPTGFRTVWRTRGLIRGMDLPRSGWN
jgi:hypothetical protein